MCTANQLPPDRLVLSIMNVVHAKQWLVQLYVAMLAWHAAMLVECSCLTACSGIVLSGRCGLNSEACHSTGVSPAAVYS